jgi:hypothetical protein
VNWHSPRRVLVLVAVISVALFVAGIATAYLHRHDKLCHDGKTPVAQRGGLLGQVIVRCQSGQIVTLNN